MTVLIANFQQMAGAFTRAANPGTSNARLAMVHDNSQGNDLYVYNASNQAVAINIGDSSVAAIFPVAGGADGHMVIPAGGTAVVEWPSTSTHIAYITASGATGNIYFTPGYGG